MTLYVIINKVFRFLEELAACCPSANDSVFAFRRRIALQVFVQARRAIDVRGMGPSVAYLEKRFNQRFKKGLMDLKNKKPTLKKKKKKRSL